MLKYFILRCNITSFLGTSSSYYCTLLQNSTSKKHVFSMLQPSDTVPRFFCFKFGGNGQYPIVRLSIQKYPAQAYISLAPLLCTVVIKAPSFAKVQISFFMGFAHCSNVADKIIFASNCDNERIPRINILFWILFHNQYPSFHFEDISE